MDWKNLPWLVFDLETTGLSIYTAEAVEVGVAAFHGGELISSGRWRIKPTIPISPGAARVHGITNQMVAHEQPMRKVAPKILAALDRFDVLAAYNGYQYDVPLLARLIPGFWMATRGRVVLDPLPLVRGVGGAPGQNKLTQVNERLGFPEEPAHDAEGDSRMTGRILWHYKDHLDDDGFMAEWQLRHWRKGQSAALAAGEAV